MINPTSSSDRSAQASAAESASARAGRQPAVRPDELALDSLPQLRQALLEQPEIRSEVVERGRALAADPGYPSTDILRQIGGLLIEAPDLTEDNL
jgi:hypothetical protein